MALLINLDDMCLAQQVKMALLINLDDMCLSQQVNPLMVFEKFHQQCEGRRSSVLIQCMNNIIG